MRPNADGSGITAVTSASAVPASGSTAACTSSKIAASTSGMSPYATTRQPSSGAIASSAIFTAWPVPSCSRWITVRTPKRRELRIELGIRHDDDVVDAGRAQRFEHPPQHRPPAQLVQHFGPRRLHARPFAGGEHDRARAHAAAPFESSGGFSRCHSFCSFALTPPSASSATRKRSRTMSRPSSAIESNSGSDVGLPVIAM